jgi:hypothetical protein
MDDKLLLQAVLPHEEMCSSGTSKIRRRGGELELRPSRSAERPTARTPWTEGYSSSGLEHGNAERLKPVLDRV